MKEIKDIISAYDKAIAQGKACALATVVHVQGSSYRRPGARMLVTDDGMLTGAISGGCLEGDALRKALLAINEGKNKLVTYDTTDEDDAKFGVQLGCNGIVHILFEPIVEGLKSNPLVLLKKIKEKRSAVIMATVFSIQAKNEQIGTCYFYDGEEEKIVLAENINENIRKRLLQESTIIWSSQKSGINTQSDEQNEIFFQYIPPALSLIIAGAGNDAMPLANMANMLGWEVTVADGRPSHASVARFPYVKKIIVAKPDQLWEQVAIDDNTVVVLMTHNYNYDLECLKILLKKQVPYIGILGPKTKMDRMYADMEKDGIIVENKEHIFSPVGLDIGAETAEEIALSIVAEIKAVNMKKNAAMLRHKNLAVHS